MTAAFWTKHQSCVLFCALGAQCLLLLRLSAQFELQLHGFLHTFPQCVCSLSLAAGAHARSASLCSESSPRFVQTSPSRLAGASAVTSPIHPNLDACQPGAARAVSMETSNKSLHTPRHSSIHLRGARTPENKPAPELCRPFITFKADEITAPRTCGATAVSRPGARSRRRREALLFPHFSSE